MAWCALVDFRWLTPSCKPAGTELLVSDSDQPVCGCGYDQPVCGCGHAVPRLWRYTHLRVGIAEKYGVFKVYLRPQLIVKIRQLFKT